MGIQDFLSSNIDKYSSLCISKKGVIIKLIKNFSFFIILSKYRFIIIREIYQYAEDIIINFLCLKIILNHLKNQSFTQLIQILKEKTSR